MKLYTIALFLSLTIAVLAVDLEDLEEEIEDARVRLGDNDDDDDMTLGELRELEQRLQRDPVAKPRAWGRWRQVSRFIRKVKPFIPIAIKLAGKSGKKRRDAEEK